ncbi:MAG: 3-hydroxyacyl-CoA dehydrogenase [Proteobacteria bacterium]|nr:3-hydroxyacyl-CoA dehydrogenase [Pseudomonadota bacterium]MBU1584801.1 3-hydroxyacyl-CoA dehydrogenase [Pseudomonadota bacterium]MBU2453404.1 3-hydroxyacyl-CoA dehydrogenase [Pseudomonadota bacterium]
MKEIKTVGIIGFGVMGAAIGINAAASGFNVIFKELNETLVSSMYDKWVIQSLKNRVEKNKLTQQAMDQITQKIMGTHRYEDLKDCDLIIEAAVENLELKTTIFETLSKICADDAIFVSNTSTFPIESVMKKVPHPDRTAGLHYFFPANVNRLVEVVRQKKTSDDTFDAVRDFAVKNKKIVIPVKDFPGFAINPVFIASYMVLNSFYGNYNVATLDSISKEALGLKYGIMWVQNSSGIGTSFHAATSLYNYLNGTDVGFLKVPEQLKTCFDNGTPWNLNDGQVIEDKTIRQVVIDRLLGAIFAIATHLVEKTIVSATDLEKGIRTSLAWPEGPFAIMNKLGMEQTRKLIVLACYSGLFKMPEKFATDIPEPWGV